LLPLIDDFAIEGSAEAAAPPLPPADGTPHAVTEAVVRELLGCLNTALLPLSHAPLPSPPILPVDNQAVIDICSLLFTLVSRSRNATIPLIFIIHGNNSTPALRHMHPTT
jgi:hypothetical protein